MQIVLISDRRIRPLKELWPHLPAAAEAGLTGVMIREKDLGGRALLEMASDAVRRCRPCGVKVLVNDRIDVALAAEADGVHLGVAAIPVAEARGIVGRRLLVGASTHSLQELSAAAEAGADYATFGPVFETRSKAAYGPPLGVESLARACAAVRLPVLGLGGISAGNAGQLRGTGIAGVAAIGALLATADPALAVREMAAALVLESNSPERRP